jgi:SAM-dependent methyltransferase
MKFTTEYRRIPLQLFRDLPPETYSERFFRAGEFSNGYVDAQSAAVLAALGALPGTESRPAWELASAAGVRAERMREFRWLLSKLARSGFLALDGRGEVRLAGPLPEAPEKLRSEILAEDPQVAANLDLIDAAAEGYPAFLRMVREGSAVLFSSRTLPLWERYFSNQNPVYAASNLLGAHAAALALAGGPARVLEVGGGLGSGAEALLERLLSAEPAGEAARRPVPASPGAPAAPASSTSRRIARYLFTELSPGFLRRAQDRLLARFPGVGLEFLPLDLNRGLAGQGAAKGSFDLVYAVNTLHVVRDLVVSLNELCASLVPGGLLVLVEGVRPSAGHPLYIEFVFQLLREFREFRRDPDCRPHGGFLEWSHWEGALKRAGFEEVRAVPDLEAAARAYPEYAMAAILARKPRGDGARPA